MTIGIIGAMEEEIAYFQRAMTDFKEEKRKFHTFYHGKWDHEEVVIVKCGIGKVNAAMTVQKMIDLFQVTKIIFTGVAGATNPMLEIGDVIVSTSSQQHDIDASALGFKKGTIPMYEGNSDFSADHHLIEIAYTSAKSVLNKGEEVYKGKVVSGDQFIADPKHVKILHDSFDADCVEMEGAAVAQVAHFNEIPFVIIRSISDKANGEASQSFDIFMKDAAKTSSIIVENMITKIKSEE
ncbi:5'-methylthioadenosine/adenosylhomocysteine nucleosidase [Salipaludibacillus daqingensis]|uniref:5'-methylthioadenosine/adenosylhomocysteine nucleosidase n=1 Tax=Salipaludibacillus daqingensis TaxID=3041001 RepID=UPI002474B3F8|nr:5'-methylthioadenosine/adenosylhomocysteine nucleosidase [Salipaludibacillus daqingensis]